MNNYNKNNNNYNLTKRAFKDALIEYERRRAKIQIIVWLLLGLPFLLAYAHFELTQLQKQKEKSQSQVRASISAEAFWYYWLARRSANNTSPIRGWANYVASTLISVPVRPAAIAAFDLWKLNTLPSRIPLFNLKNLGKFLFIPKLDPATRPEDNNLEEIRIADEEINFLEEYLRHFSQWISR